MRKYDKIWTETMRRFGDNTGGFVLEVKRIKPSEQSYLIQYRGGNSSYWSHLAIMPGWWAFNSDMGAWSCARYVPMVAWTANSIIRDNSYLAGKLVCGEHERFSVEETKSAICHMLKESESPEQLSELLSSEWFTEQELLDACCRIDREHGTNIVLDVDIYYEITFQWVWASICIATMLDHPDFRKVFEADGYGRSFGTDFVLGLKDLREQSVAVEMVERAEKLI